MCADVYRADTLEHKTFLLWRPMHQVKEIFKKYHTLLLLLSLGKCVHTQAHTHYTTPCFYGVAALTAEKAVAASALSPPPPSLPRELARCASCFCILFELSGAPARQGRCFFLISITDFHRPFIIVTVTAQIKLHHSTYTHASSFPPPSHLSKDQQSRLGFQMHSF